MANCKLRRLSLLLAALSAVAYPAEAHDRGRSPVQVLVLKYFDNRRAVSVDEFLTQSRPAPPGPSDCAAVIASLPNEQDVDPRPAEMAKIQAALPLLQYHQRQGIVTFKVVELDHAFVGLYARSILIVSRLALWALDSAEFVAVIAHEIAHDYMWDAYQQAISRKDTKKMQELELLCDGIAVLTLRHLGLDPERLVSAVQKLTHLNQLREAGDTNARYVPLKERTAFIRAMARLQWE
jgi:hypothetical protein